ncbi:hypothetical protein CEUSTIGMA_g841.t1 [Chlamydomonas eustigma]|uniref:SH2 domain-containing protein n=1 Tax=Chlamydomonas eustigma TaxID=1157962 RepID=A0A250WRE0_9CHLO|nr:hypothetical protein CEUSTIGMA_g841.t1 [Chlamydomonas eustigma]|eukprot:GAX73388.1 hypothetical protein CEUSTIGMA_g841.t1 [Chlamydomonas eustigma]
MQSLSESELLDLVSRRDAMPGVDKLQSCYVKYYRQNEAQTAGQAGWSATSSKRNYEDIFAGAEKQLASSWDPQRILSDPRRVPEHISMRIVKAPAEFTFPVKQDRRLFPNFKVKVAVKYRGDAFSFPVTVRAYIITQHEKDNILSWQPPTTTTAAGELSSSLSAASYSESSDKMKLKPMTELKGMTSISHHFQHIEAGYLHQHYHRSHRPSSTSANNSSSHTYVLGSGSYMAQPWVLTGQPGSYMPFFSKRDMNAGGVVPRFNQLMVAEDGNAGGASCGLTQVDSSSLHDGSTDQVALATSLLMRTGSSSSWPATSSAPSPHGFHPHAFFPQSMFNISGTSDTGLYTQLPQHQTKVQPQQYLVVPPADVSLPAAQAEYQNLAAALSTHNATLLATNRDVMLGIQQFGNNKHGEPAEVFPQSMLGAGGLVVPGNSCVTPALPYVDGGSGLSEEAALGYHLPAHKFSVEPAGEAPVAKGQEFLGHNSMMGSPFFLQAVQAAGQAPVVEGGRDIGMGAADSAFLQLLQREVPPDQTFSSGSQQLTPMAPPAVQHQYPDVVNNQAQVFHPSLMMAPGADTLQPQILRTLEHDFDFQQLEFAGPTRMNKVYVVFAANIMDSDTVFVVYNVPTIGICRAEQRRRACEKLGVPSVAAAAVEAVPGLIPTPHEEAEEVQVDNIIRGQSSVAAMHDERVLSSQLLTVSSGSWQPDNPRVHPEGPLLSIQHQQQQQGPVSGFSQRTAETPTVTLSTSTVPLSPPTVPLSSSAVGEPVSSLLPASLKSFTWNATMSAAESRQWSQEEIREWLLEEYEGTGLTRKLKHLDVQALLSQAGFPQSLKPTAMNPAHDIMRISGNQAVSFMTQFRSILSLLSQISMVWNMEDPHVVSGFDMDRVGATKALSNQPLGTFICRFSITQPGCLVLSCKTCEDMGTSPEEVMHAIIEIGNLSQRRVDTWIRDFSRGTHVLDVYSQKRVDKRKVFASNYTRLNGLNVPASSSVGMPASSGN